MNAIFRWMGCGRSWLRVCGLFLFSLGLAGAEVRLPAGFQREVLAGPELAEPMDLTFAPDGAVWVVGRGGSLWRVDATTRSRSDLGQIATDTVGDRGLHGIALHPDFQTNGEVFLFTMRRSIRRGVTSVG